MENNRYPQGASLSARSKGVQNQTFYVVNVRDLNYVLKDLHNLTFLIVLVGLLAGVICVLIAVSFSKDMDRSVKPILNAMDKANEGNMEVRVPEEGMDEFARIGRHFTVCSARYAHPMSRKRRPWYGKNTRR